MDNIVEYLIKSGIALGVFYLFYWLLMRKSTHFGLNRLTLATSLIASLILPLIKIDLTPEVVAGSIPVMSIDLTTVVQIVSKPEPAWGIREVVLLIYFSGMAITLFRLIYQSIYIHVISKMSRTITKGKHTIVLVEKEITPFAYFSKIFIPASKMEETSFESILAHEKSHLKQYHYLDLFLIEVVTIVQWFNPIVWLYERSLKEVHEYMADDEVLKQGVSKGNYQALLVNQALGGPVFTISHQFNQSLILKRIKMMTKMKSPQLAKIKVLLFIPLTAGLLMAFSNPEPIVNPVTEKIESFTQQIAGTKIVQDENTAQDTSITKKGSITIIGKVIDASTSQPVKGVNVIVQGTTSGATSDENGSFKVITDNPKATILIFSHISYTTSIYEYKSGGNIEVKMQKGAQELNEVTVTYLGKDDGTKTQSPKYVLIDGVQSDEQTFKSMEINAFKEVSLLNKESASKLFGEKGRNGAIVAVTKKGNTTIDKSVKAVADNFEITDENNKTTTEGHKAVNSEVYTVVEEMPLFPGGENARIKFFSNNLRAPAEGVKEGSSGTVYVSFIVQADGSITNAKVLRGIGKSFDEEVLRVVNLMPKWNPGKQNGEAVAVVFNLPVKYVKQ
jgi:TonB family protein